MNRLCRRFALVALALLAAAAAPAAAQQWEDYDYENLEFRAVGFHVGGLLPTRVESTLSIGLQADLSYLGPHVRLIPSFTYWTSELKQGKVDNLATQIRAICLRQQEQGASCPLLRLGEIKLSDLALNLDAQYVFAGNRFASPYAGAGVGVHFLNGSGEAIDETFVEDFLDTLSPGINVMAGLTTHAFAPLNFFGELRAVATPDISGASALVGLMWELPRPPARAAVVPVTAPMP